MDGTGTATEAAAEAEEAPLNAGETSGNRGIQATKSSQTINFCPITILVLISSLLNVLSHYQMFVGQFWTNLIAPPHIGRYVGNQYVEVL